MRHLVSSAAALSLLTLCLGCATTTRQPQTAEFRGRYMSGFEVSRFTSCDAPPTDQPWWAIFSGQALRQRDSLIARLPEGAGAEVFVRWRGTAGPQEAAGHLGRSTRYFHVSEILELRALQETDCGKANSPFSPGVPASPK